MVNEVRQVIDVVADIPGFPAYVALIVPGLCAWLFIWAREKKENSHFPREDKRKAPSSKIDSNKSG